MPRFGTPVPRRRLDEPGGHEVRTELGDQSGRHDVGVGGAPKEIGLYRSEKRATGVEPATSSLGSFLGPCGARVFRRR